MRIDVSLMAAMLFSAFSHAQLMPPVPQPKAQDVQVGVGDLNGDGWLDVVVPHIGQHRVEMRVQLGEELVSVNTVSVASPVAAELSNVTGDERPELLVLTGGASQPRLWIFAVGVDLQTALLAEIPLQATAMMIVPLDICQDGLREILVATRDLAAVSLVQDEMTGFNVVPVDLITGEGLPDCERATTACNNATEPDCDPNPTDPGIQACLEATSCRRDKCSWAACIHYHYEGGWKVTFVTENLACASVSLIERVACLSPLRS